VILLFNWKHYMWSYYAIENIICDPIMQLKTIYVILLCNWKHYSHRCTVAFKFFWGGTWSCEKFEKGVLYFLDLLQFYDPIFQSLMRGYMRCPGPPPPPSPSPSSHVHLWLYVIPLINWKHYCDPIKLRFLYVRNNLLVKCFFSER
jgi:hypothetical protein